MSSIVAIEGREGHPGGVVFLESGHFIVLSQPDFERLSEAWSSEAKNVLAIKGATMSVGFSLEDEMPHPQAEDTKSE